MSTSLAVFATVPKGMEPLLTNELHDTFKVSQISPTRAGVAFQGTMTQIYQICLWSRIANRILLPLSTFAAPEPQALYEGVQTIRWYEHMTPNDSLAVDFTSRHSQLQHTHFGALKVKDAIVDQFRNRYQLRPNIKRQQPNIRINVHLEHDQATVSIDLTGDSLHRRGYRSSSGPAPLKENLAAAILLWANWPQIAAQGGQLLDPMCGSGTLLIEAAWIAADIAPGLLRSYFGLLHWRQHDANLWANLLAEAQQRQVEGLLQLPQITGYDIDKAAIRNALAQVERAGLTGKIHLEKRAVAQLTALPTPGLLVTNPPYGERLGDYEATKQLYSHLGEVLRTQFQGWQAAVVAGDVDLGKRIGIRANQRYTLYNGALECKLLGFNIEPQWFMPMQTSTEPFWSQRSLVPLANSAAKWSQGAQMLANRLQKNLKQLKRWIQRQQIQCFRLYDADLPEYAIAIDIYEQWIHVQEYAPPKTIEPHKAQARLQEAIAVIADLLATPPSRIFLKCRQPQKGKTQYQQHHNKGQFYEVHEGKAIFLINLTDYLDTGLFLDHRLTRQLIFSLAQGRRFLNLFGYTGTATVQAALGGAIATTTVDTSKNYLAWAHRNLVRNGFSESHHQLIQADCLSWLQQTADRFAQSPRLGSYGLIFLDPPTFSNSKKTNQILDIQRDHVKLIHMALKCLTRDGLLIFSTNYQKFNLDVQAFTQLQLENISHLTLPKDFARNPRIHQCWKIYPRIDR
jgi:23S rRNA (guanine2445-N2)-methyltransferase / 23S rRNA (guanine2069-N7)-methyltransferase